MAHRKKDSDMKRERLGARTHVTLPGDTQLAMGVDWAKQNLADSTQHAEDLEIRWVDQGRLPVR